MPRPRLRGSPEEEWPALLSPQYLIWLAPAAGIVWLEDDTSLAVITAIAIVLTQIFWSRYGSVLRGDLPALLTVVLRNAVLIGLAVSAIASLRRPARSISNRRNR